MKEEKESRCEFLSTCITAYVHLSPPQTSWFSQNMLSFHIRPHILIFILQNFFWSGEQTGTGKYLELWSSHRCKSDKGLTLQESLIEHPCLKHFILNLQSLVIVQLSEKAQEACGGATHYPFIHLLLSPPRWLSAPSSPTSPQAFSRPFPPNL